MSFAYMPFFTGDYLRDTRHLTPLRHGVYILALMHCWDSKGPMPLDEQECAGICNCRSADEVEAMRYVINRFFTRMDDGHYNKRMQVEIERSNVLSDKRSGAAHERWKARESIKSIDATRHASAMQVHSKSNASGTTPSPSPSPSLASSPPPTPTKRKKPSPAAADAAAAAPTSAVWEAYSQAYAEKYKVEPVRNAKVNSQLVQLVARLGAAEAPDVARSYLSNRNSLYMASKHCVDLLLRDAEKLRTEWVTGEVTHQRDASEADRIGSTGAMWGRVAAKLEAKGIK